MEQLAAAIKVPHPYRWDKRDFIQLGKDMMFIGTGLETDDGAVNYLLTQRILSTPYVAVVRDLFDRHPER
jgi:arginine deiminase